MLKKTIKYTDFNGTEREEDFYFHLSKAELMELEMSKGEKGLVDYMENIVASKDSAEILEVFKKIIKKAYGVKSKDGRRFTKNPEVLADFMETNAYSELFMEIGFNEEKAAEFINGVVPNNLGN